VLFLAALVVCAVREYELWPFSSWRLFSHLRTGRQVSWQAAAVDLEGRESVIDFGALPRSFHGNVGVLSGFSKLTPRERDDVCRSWARAVRRRGRDVTEIRIYRDITVTPLGRDQQPSVEAHELQYVCRL
jgi:hypothetical protein